MTNKIPVVFRKWRDSSDVFALFPTLRESGHYVRSYEHIGQHSAADYHGCIAQSYPASPSEYATLRRELESAPYHYSLRPMRRAPAWSSISLLADETTRAAEDGQPKDGQLD